MSFKLNGVVPHHYILVELEYLMLGEELIGTHFLVANYVFDCVVGILISLWAYACLSVNVVGGFIQLVNTCILSKEGSAIGI